VNQSCRALAAIAVAVALGCFGGNAAPRYFTLSAAAGPAAGDPIASLPELGIAVGPLELPRYLDRPELVVRDGSNRLVVADADRWGGSLRNDVLRVVADDLGRLLGTARVAVYPAEPRFEAQRRVLLDVRELDGVPGQSISLRVRWTIASLPDGRALAVEEQVIREAVASQDTEAMVAAASSALGSVSRAIADRLAAMPVAEAVKKPGSRTR
jgi:uncharacterized lipoprotein YmbA